MLTIGYAALGVFALLLALTSGMGYLRADRVVRLGLKRHPERSDFSPQVRTRLVRAYTGSAFIGSLLILGVVISKAAE
jgi:hypothetical protein